MLPEEFVVGWPARAGAIEKFGVQVLNCKSPERQGSVFYRLVSIGNIVETWIESELKQRVGRHLAAAEKVVIAAFAYVSEIKTKFKCMSAAYPAERISVADRSRAARLAVGSQCNTSN